MVESETMLRRSSDLGCPEAVVRSVSTMAGTAHDPDATTVEQVYRETGAPATVDPKTRRSRIFAGAAKQAARDGAVDVEELRVLIRGARNIF